MSVTNELQKLIYDRLVADTGVHAACADRIFDKAVPKGTAFPYVTFQSVDGTEDDAECISGQEITFTLAAWSRYQGGKKDINGLVDAVRKALHLYAGELTVNALAEMSVPSWRIHDDPDGITQQGVIVVRCMVEEA